ncbi:MAG: helix-turn-helix transcriptional regulator [Oceanospirillaceae bacterium]|nr:helix-turn-helix transcriptional regulator [Oceanospirillaceae bacterium]
MSFNRLTPHAIAEALGDRMKTARLNANLTQKALAKAAGVSLKAVTNGEKGKSTLESMIAILIALELTEQLNSFIPKPEISPIALMKLQGKKRKRAASPSKSNSPSKSTSTW